MEDPSWTRNCQSLTSSLQALDKKMSSIRRSTNKLGSLKDINREREKVKKTTASINSADVPALEEQLRLVDRFVHLRPNLRTEGVKLMTEAQSVLQNYRNVCDQFYMRCISVEETSRGKMSDRLDHSYEDNSGADDEAAEALPKTQVHTQKVTFEKDLYDDIMAERARETNEISENVKDINEIFQHINEMMGDQGAKLEIVDSNLTAAENATRGGNQQLRKAQQYQETTSRNKVLFLFLILTIVFVFGSLLIY